ncbi:hypothetical protein DINM_005526 [Dirofilaria immitis]|nr:hypothetical protein [Dirofilaria immitis]
MDLINLYNDRGNDLNTVYIVRSLNVNTKNISTGITCPNCTRRVTVALRATEKFFDERKKEIEAKKQKEEEIWRAREAAQQMQEQGSSFDRPAIQILKRPSGCEMQSSSSQHDMTKLEEKARTMTLQEREAAYLQARERIFGGVYRYDEDRDITFDPTSQMVRSGASCVPAGLPLPHPSYHASNPRPRLPAIMRTPRPPLYQQPLPLGIPPFGIPPPLPGAYTPSLPQVSQQRFPIAGIQHAPNTQRLPYFDSRIPPPAAPPPPYMGQNLGQNLIEMNPAFSDPARNPVPYGQKHPALKTSLANYGVLNFFILDSAFAHIEFTKKCDFHSYRTYIIGSFLDVSSLSREK